jgi:hypothetical protein
MTDTERGQIEIQIEQITAFLKSVYAGMAHDIEIRWRFGGGVDPIGRIVEQSTADHWRKEYGKHEKITLGVGDAYYGSASISGMLYHLAHDMRERLQNKIEEASRPRTMADL